REHFNFGSRRGGDKQVPCPHPVVTGGNFCLDFSDGGEVRVGGGKNLVEFGGEKIFQRVGLGFGVHTADGFLAAQGGNQIGTFDFHNNVLYLDVILNLRP